MKRSKVLIATAMIACAAAILVVSNRSRDSRANVEANWPNLASGVPYVGDQQCNACHQTIAESFSRSGMARSWSAATPDRLDKPHRLTTEVADAKSNLQYRAFEVSGFFFQEEFRANAEGEKVHSLERPVNYVVGSGTHGLSLITQHNGFLNLLPLGWYAEAGKWDLSPGYERHNPRFDRIVPLECISCHNALPKHVDGSRNRYELPLPTGIDCERCHGPGALHVEKQSKLASLQGAASGHGDNTIVNPARLPVDRRDDVCLQCHLISDVAVLARGKSWTDFRPGERLTKTRHDFFVQPEDPARFGFSSHASRLRLSRCWSEGDTRGEMTCISCHNPHVALAEFPQQSYSQACLKCHTPPDCRRDRGALQAAGERAGDNNCVSCHMRKGSPANVAHTVFTDHWIRTRPEPLVESAPGARSIGAMKPIKLIDFWEKTEPASAGTRALALVQYMDTNQIADQRPAIDALELALEQDSNNPELQFWLGVALAKQGNWRGSLRYYESACAQRTDAIARFSLGEAQRNAGRLKDAVITLRETLDLYPDFLEAYREIAETFVSLNDVNRAIEALDRSLDRFPYQGEVRVRRAHLGYLAGETVGRVYEQIAEARRLQPDSASLYWLEAQCQIDEGKRADAIRSLEHALLRDERSIPALLSIGPLLAEEGRFEDARQRLAQLRAIAPNHPMLQKAQVELDRAIRAKKRTDSR